MHPEFFSKQWDAVAAAAFFVFRQIVFRQMKLAKWRFFVWLKMEAHLAKNELIRWFLKKSISL